MIYNKNTAYFRFKGTTFCRNSKGIAEKARKNTRQAYAIAALMYFCSQPSSLMVSRTFTTRTDEGRGEDKSRTNIIRVQISPCFFSNPLPRIRHLPA